MSQSRQVFIISPHNPEPYVRPPTAEELQRKYPQLSAHEIIQQLEAREAEDDEKILQHDKLVGSFIRFLIENGVNAAHESQITDEIVPNKMKWYQDQLKLSTYIILIITKSFHYFLTNPRSFPHNGEESIFEGDFLYNVIHLSKKPLLPVYLGGDVKDLGLLPDALRMSSTYHVKTDFSLQHSETATLYAILTGQNTCAPLPPGPVVQLPGPRRFGPRKKVQHQQMASGLNKAKYDSLKSCSRLLTNEIALKVAETEVFARLWKKLAAFLGIGDANVEEIEGTDPDKSEQCYNMLKAWKDRENGQAFVSRLAEAVWKCQDPTLLDIAHKIFILTSY